jgi:hypothetical protein
MWEFIVRRGAGIGSGFLAMGAQVSGFTNAAIALACVAVAAFFFVAPVWHHAHIWHKNRLAVGKRSVDSTYLIIGGLSGVVLFGLIALGGYIWQLRNPLPNPQVAALQTEVANLRDGLAKALQPKTPATRLGQVQAQPKPEIKRYTAYEKEQRLRAVDEIYNVIVTKLQPTYADGQILLDDIYRGSVIEGGPEQRLTDYRKKAQEAFDSLNGLLKKYDYFQDIVQVTKKNTFNDVEATHGVGNLVPEIQALR